MYIQPSPTHQTTYYHLTFMHCLAAQNQSMWGPKFEALKITLHLVNYFGKYLGAYMPAIMADCWRMFTSGVALYQSVMVQGEECEGGDEGADVDVEGDVLDLEAIASQVVQGFSMKRMRPAVGGMTQKACVYCV